MMRHISKEETLIQSKRAFNRWGEIWADNATSNTEMYKQFNPVFNCGHGQSIIIASFGPSLIENIKDIKEHKLHYECKVMCVDKALKTLIENGIVPDFVVLADAQVSFEKYGNIDPEYVKSISLISCITANKKWVMHWKDNGGKYCFFVNKDAIDSHILYGKTLGEKYVPNRHFQKAMIIPASSNVGNAAVVISSLIMNFSTIYLIGYDYSYKGTGSYYGSDKFEEGGPRDTNMGLKKHRFNNHLTAITYDNDVCIASENMNFSCRWLIDFCNTVGKQKGVVFYNLTGTGLLDIPGCGYLTSKN